MGAVEMLPTTAAVTDDQDAHPAEFRVVVPIFNEADLLDEILTRTQSLGYLDRVTFVNDASTDASGAILDRWRDAAGIDVLHLARNNKKEGAIRAALETLEAQRRLPKLVVLLDADSFMSSAGTGTGIDKAIARAAAHMDSNDFAAMGFRYDIFLPAAPSLLQRAQFAEFAGLRFMNRVAPDQHQMWVINGRGGIFRSDILLPVLREMEPDFETGDILITQKIMKAGYKIAYYDKIKVETMDVNTVKDYCRQRRRWARGTTKVMFNERAYYSKEFAKFSKVGLVGMLYLIIDLGIPLSIIGTLLLVDDPLQFFLYKVPTMMAAWMMIGTALAVSDRGIRDEGFAGKVARWSLLNGFLYVGVTMPSRLIGLCDTLRHIVSKAAKTDAARSADWDAYPIRERQSVRSFDANPGALCQAAEN